jgi:hypothetical protein
MPIRDSWTAIKSSQGGLMKINFDAKNAHTLAAAHTLDKFLSFTLFYGLSHLFFIDPFLGVTIGLGVELALSLVLLKVFKKRLGHGA